ncbi:hypothetical protein Tcan_02949 [Toxocara canis]|uniref:Uncharacterized protein n=1 Tax=Toxocara canis TaxID=6265 RepID=A0A0B2W5P7_TOXCA|nr:hypothetical protein Tcan_02949 [Toxocara canis]
MRDQLVNRADNVHVKEAFEVSNHPLLTGSGKGLGRAETREGAVRTLLHPQQHTDRDTTSATALKAMAASEERKLELERKKQKLAEMNKDKNVERKSDVACCLEDHLWRTEHESVLEAELRIEEDMSDVRILQATVESSHANDPHPVIGGKPKLD